MTPGTASRGSEERGERGKDLYLRLLVAYARKKMAERRRDQARMAMAKTGEEQVRESGADRNIPTSA